MFDIYDLYDLYAVFLNIRYLPEYELNSEILSKTIEVIKNESENSISNKNSIRKALCVIDGIDKDLYKFCFVNNVYTYTPFLIKDVRLYLLLCKACNNLLDAVFNKDYEKVYDLSDCLHNLPILITENFNKVPKSFWKNEIGSYRKKWDKYFLKEIQKMF